MYSRVIPAIADEICDLGEKFRFELELPFVAVKHKCVLPAKGSNRVDRRHKMLVFLRKFGTRREIAK